jgi:hypothetical protein
VQQSPHQRLCCTTSTCCTTPVLVAQPRTRRPTPGHFRPDFKRFVGLGDPSDARPPRLLHNLTCPSRLCNKARADGRAWEYSHFRMARHQADKSTRAGEGAFETETAGLSPLARGRRQWWARVADAERRARDSGSVGSAPGLSGATSSGGVRVNRGQDTEQGRSAAGPRGLPTATDAGHGARPLEAGMQRCRLLGIRRTHRTETPR